MTDTANTPARPKLRICGTSIKTTSTDIVMHFDKNHRDVLRAIKNLECSESFNERNFALVEYTDEKGEKRPMYEITRDGFVFVAMGFTGAKAARWKEAYIEAFSKMEAYIREREAPQPQQPKLTASDEMVQVDRRDLMSFAFRMLAMIKKAEPIIGSGFVMMLEGDLQRMQETSGVRLLDKVGAA